MLTPVTEAVEADLRAALPQAAFRPLEPRYLEEPRGRHKGADGFLVAPGSTEEVAAAIRTAAQHRVPVVPYSGGTGLVGGQIYAQGPRPLILSLERMRAIRGTYPRENVLVAEAGAVLVDVQAAAEEAGRLFPLSLASEGTAMIGGLLSTNAGGTAVLRYGNSRDLVLGVEAVLPDGQILGGLKRLRKDNTGFDLRHMLIGSEGALGVITAATLRLFPRPASSATAVMAVTSPEAALDLLALARDVMGDGVSGFELISRTGYDFLADKLPQIRRPFDPAPDWTVLVEVGLSGGAEADTALERLFELGVEADLVTDGLIAQNQAQRAEFWHMRESIPEANRLVGAVASHDISVPLDALPTFIDRAPAAVASFGDFRINCFGHVGDGNLHWNVFPMPGHAKSEHDDVRADVTHAVHDLAHSLGGSVSAEHGIGRLKVGDLERYGDPAKLSAMRAIKAALDPAGIMNPGAVLRGED